MSVLGFAASLTTLALSVAQLHVIWRLISSARRRIAVSPPGTPAEHGLGHVSVLIPVYDEQTRLAPCLEGTLRFSQTVTELLVVDTGSRDRTLAVARSYASRDSRVRIVTAGDPPRGWNGKSWGIVRGVEAASPDSNWILVLDADVRPSPLLPDRLVEACESLGVRCASVALQQVLPPDPLSWLLHPAMLASLVYRLGLPGRIDTSPNRAFANGQALLLHRSVLASIENGRVAVFANAEDVAIARRLAAVGEPVAFLDALDDTFVTMYPDGRRVWTSWPRSLPLRDGRRGFDAAIDLLVLAATQGSWLPLLLLSFASHRARGIRSLALCAAAVRVGITIGMRRAYRWLSAWYWLSPILDPLVVARILWAAVNPRPVWRGRVIGRGALK